MTIVSSVHYDTSYDNAFWSEQLQQMVYGDAYGFAFADDVVGHELTHGVTNYTSKLFYYYQSGAINESFSDLWGEFIDLTNGSGNDAVAVRWLIGEDISGLGAIRDMADPTVFGDPDRMTSPYYYTGSSDWDNFGDNGGVHTNNGVNNKAVFLMTDGGSFNGYSITGLGLNKVAAIYYEVQTSLLTSGADYQDLYYAVYQACSGLVGGAQGITTTDCSEVQKALDAVEMGSQPTAGYNPHAVVCPSGFEPNHIFFDDIESGSSLWAYFSVNGTSSWGIDTSYATSGTSHLWGDDYYTMSDSYAVMSTNATLPSGSQPYLHFNHAFGFEDPDYDGGFLEYSTNAGASWTDAGSLFDSGLDYTGTIFDPGPEPGANPNRGRIAFIGDSHGYVSTRYDLSLLAGEDVRFRWRVSTDTSIYDWGWFVDDVRIYTCVEPTTVQPYLPVAADFDADGYDDIGFYREGLWGVLQSSLGYDYNQARWFSWGAAGDEPTVGDYDGDGFADPAVRTPPAGVESSAYLKLLSSFAYDYGQSEYFPAGWPSLGDVPIIGDFDGDGKTDHGVWRSSQGIWIIPLSSLDPAVDPMDPFRYQFALWGQQGDIPVVADFDGDGRDDIAFYRNGLWGVLKSSLNYDFNQAGWFSWGAAGDEPIAGDYDGDGLADPAVWTPPAGGESAAYLLLLSGTGYDYGQTRWIPAGWPSLGDTPVLGDYDADGMTDPGIWRESNGVWIIPLSSQDFGGYLFAQWGQ